MEYILYILAFSGESHNPSQHTRKLNHEHPERGLYRLTARCAVHRRKRVALYRFLFVPSHALSCPVAITGGSTLLILLRRPFLSCNADRTNLFSEQGSLRIVRQKSSPLLKTHNIRFRKQVDCTNPYPADRGHVTGWPASCKCHLSNTRGYLKRQGNFRNVKERMRPPNGQNDILRYLK